MVARRSVTEMANRAESVLIDRARRTTEPMTYQELAAAITYADERTYPVRNTKAALKHMGEKGSYSFSGRLTAWVVDESGVPGEGYFATPGSDDDPSATRQRTHDYLTAYFAADGD